MIFDPELATQAYMATLSGAARARSDAYFEGGYWLILWSALAAIVANLIILRTGMAAAISRWARRTSRLRWLRSFLFAVPYLMLATLITLPLDIWSRFVREHDYGLSNQDFGAWASEAALDIVISTILLSLLFIGIHAAIRRAPRSWWAIGTGLTAAGLTVMIMLAPLFIEPLFNKYTPLPASPVRDAVLAMARANGVPATNVYLVDASRQSKRISANVAGLGGTTRIALNDNLMRQPADEVRAVLGHEIGHYVLNHVVKLIVTLTVILAIGFFIASRVLPALLARFGARWGVTEVADPAILPVLLLVATVLGLLLTPLMNTLVRTNEIEADLYGLNAARAPDAFARTAIKLSQYRKIEPSPLEEAIFFDHPSGHTRVLTAMRWKAEHLGQPDVR
ncbi:M48 family metallopeptidase [Sandarakinorhabdus sp. DWP1-3-1]|uniref:M48 family metallopeptidase n=1 Tax=Sandarakinorhabdus sp. DWP1-3-1 TaxID=2804627 RepID=UPI003CE7315F